MRHLTAFVIVLSGVATARATDQVTDDLLYTGKVLQTSGIWFVESYEDGKRPAVLDEGLSSTANHKGYYARWVIKDDKLFLDSAQQMVWKDKDKKETVLRDIPLHLLRPKIKSPALADWYTGIVRGGSGDLASWKPERVWKHEFIFLIENGIVKRTGEIKQEDHDPYRSHDDLVWCALGKPPKDAKNDWVDARLVATKMSDAGPVKLKTRGAIGISEKSGTLFVSWSKKTELVHIELEDIPADVKFKSMDHGEIEGTVRREGKELKMKVTSLRRLEFGESVHAASFAEDAKRLKPAETPAKE